VVCPFHSTPHSSLLSSAECPLSFTASERTARLVLALPHISNDLAATIYFLHPALTRNLDTQPRHSTSTLNLNSQCAIESEHSAGRPFHPTAQQRRYSREQLPFRRLRQVTEVHDAHEKMSATNQLSFEEAFEKLLPTELKQMIFKFTATDEDNTNELYVKLAADQASSPTYTPVFSHRVTGKSEEA
jgi:hypothetical protein